ncbi:M48 metallopeptidase family protein [Rhodopirellula europaea]|nr:M48 family metallopeptidase [Rhodopirellula europaea]
MVVDNHQSVLSNRFCQMLGVEASEVVIRNYSQRWGSATQNGRLAFNWRIIMAPRPLIDYVAAHEACHLIHNDHSADFWRLLERIMPDYESRRLQLAINGAKFQL